MQQDSLTPVTDLRNFGAVTAQRLADIGIHTLGDIEALGAVETFARLRFVYGAGVTRNALHALEATLRDMDWRDLSPDVKAGLEVAIAERETVSRARHAS